MSRDRFRAVVTAFVTYNGKVLIGKKEDDDDHPIGGKWHILGGHLEHGEDIEEAIKREVKEETGLDVEVHQLVDVMTFSWDDDEDEESIRFVYHVEADSDDAEPDDDLSEVKWVEPSDLADALETKDADRVKDRAHQRNFIEKLEKMPAF
ncbi:MAG: NUDIX hydrolase [Candidatus Nanohaloarchaea archaeon]